MTNFRCCQKFPALPLWNLSCKRFCCFISYIHHTSKFPTNLAKITKFFIWSRVNSSINFLISSDFPSTFSMIWLTEGGKTNELISENIDKVLPLNPPIKKVEERKKKYFIFCFILVPFLSSWNIATFVIDVKSGIKPNKLID